MTAVALPFLAGMSLATIGAGSALAAPFAGAAPSTTRPAIADAPIEQVHGCHRGVQRDYRGWHFHTRACVRQPTAPPGLYDRPAYRRYYRGPICSYQCRHVGPVKTCQQVCR